MFTIYSTSPSRNFADINYALYRVRMISRDVKENPPYSLSDEEWIEFLEDTKYNRTYQVFLAVLAAISTNPERLTSLTEASGSYAFSDLEQVKKALRDRQADLNTKLGLGRRTGGFVAVPVVVNQPQYIQVTGYLGVDNADSFF